MFVGKIFSAAVLGFTALAGIATASVVPAPAFDVKPRAEVNSTQAGLDIVTSSKPTSMEFFLSLLTMIEPSRTQLQSSKPSSGTMVKPPRPSPPSPAFLP
ncbi:hypothetical protein FRC03_005035 [Tulasnella sp. 419]|nr:hypothetical protein FRC03_005035 [Tulasnella sp. 419]